MKKRYKVYLKINLVSLVLVVISFISITLAWFAYSGLSKVSTDINVKAWYIEVNGRTDLNRMSVTFSNLYPGMETVSEEVIITNSGDSDAQLSYAVTSARILGDPLDNYVVNDDLTTEEVEDMLSHKYPFKINISLDKSYIKAGKNDPTIENEAVFKVSVSWPLDSVSWPINVDANEQDSIWGSKAFEFQESEAILAREPSYQARPSIQIAINVTAEQYVSNATASDMNYNLGDVILFDVGNVIDNKRLCTVLGGTCIKTYVIDNNNTLGDAFVTLLPDPLANYETSTFDNYATTFTNAISSWSLPRAQVRNLEVNDILNIVSKDITDSVLIVPDMPNSIIGNLSYSNRFNDELLKAKTYSGHYMFNDTIYNFLSSVNCYWTNTEYNTNKAFAVQKIPNYGSKIYDEVKNTSCNVIPIIEASKDSLK